MVSHIIIDKWYLTISFLITLAWQLTGFAIAWTFKFDKITDFTGGSNFFILALITMLTGPYETRNKVASAMMMGWAARLALFLLFRVLKTGSDNRFDEIRSKFWSFAGFWAGQILWVWIVAFPIVTVNSPGVSDRLYGGRRVVVGAAASDIVGIVLFAIGFLVESISDIQKFMYKSSNPPKGKPCDKGLWKWCRHPPYFGEILVHWGLWIFVMGVTWDDPSYVSGSVKAVQYAGIISPVFTMLLLFFLSGLPTAEKPTAKKHYLASHEVPGTNTFSPPKPTSDSWDNYKEYLSRTSIVIPIPPRLYKPLPEWFKRTVLLDFPMYRFDEDKDGKEALEEQRKKRAEESDA